MKSSPSYSLSSLAASQAIANACMLMQQATQYVTNLWGFLVHNLDKQLLERLKSAFEIADCMFGLDMNVR
jgi:hypothetical protein